MKAARFVAKQAELAKKLAELKALKAERAAKVAKTKSQILAENRAAGKAAEKLVAKQLEAEANKILGSQVTVKTSKGNRVVDHLIETPDGKIVAVEVKSGGAVRSSEQLAKDNAMATEGTIIGKNAPTALKGKKLPIDTIERRVP